MLFLTLTLNFKLILLLSKKGYNTLILIICKFSKRVTLIKEKNSFTAKKWACVFFIRLDLVYWSLFEELITDCNPKFISNFGTTFFNKLYVKLLYNIAYHPQTNGLNKKTNQTVEMILCFFLLMHLKTLLIGLKPFFISKPSSIIPLFQ